MSLRLCVKRSPFTLSHAAKPSFSLVFHYPGAGQVIEEGSFLGIEDGDEIGEDGEEAGELGEQAF